MLNQAVILCGGLGTRLGDITENTPKPLITVGDRPFLDHLIQETSRYGFKNVLLLAGHYGEQIHHRYHNKTRYGVNITVAIEPEPLGTGGGLRHALDLLDDRFVLMNGDSWVDYNLVRFMFESQGSNFHMLTYLTGDASRYGSITHKENRVTGFIEKNLFNTTNGYINAGVYVLNKTIVEQIPADTNVSLEQTVIPHMVKDRAVTVSFASAGTYFIDIGIPEAYEQAQTEVMAARTRPALFLDRDGTLNEDYGYTYETEKLIWIKGAKDLIKYANDSGWYVFVVTNQAGIAHGYYGPEDVIKFHNAMQAELAEIGAHIDDMVYCPYHPDGRVPQYTQLSEFRKPGPGMLNGLMNKWPVNKDLSVMIGDKEIDVDAGLNAGVHSLKFTSDNLCKFFRKEVLNADK